MKKAAAALFLVLASLALVACGSSSSSSSSNTTTSESGAAAGGGEKASGGGETISLEADPNGQLAYTTTTATAKAGNVTIDFNNPNSALGHDVCVQDPNGKKLGCSQVVTGGKTTLDLSNLKSGSYTFYCSVDSHEAAGMKGTLTVQ
jgi:plastocyanin